MESYFLYLLGFLVVMIAQSGVQNSYHKYKSVANAKGLSGEQVARAILDYNGLQDVQVEVSKGGMLSDHYDPVNKVVRLSSDIFYNRSIASISVAAHECGHAIQHKENYGAIALRNQLLPAANIASQLGWFVIFIGLLMFSNAPIILWIGIGLLCVIALFQLVTLPVEINASTRAIKQLSALNFIYDEEVPHVRSMLKAAAFTYIASLVATLANILRIVLIANRRNDD